jgi:hypothetical protein
MLNKSTIAILATLVVSTAGCSGGSILMNPAATFPIPVSDTTPAFLFPINVSHAGLPGDPAVGGLAITGGMAAHFGKKVISGQQLFDLVGNLSFDLAEGIQREAKSNTWTMSGPDEHIATALAGIMQAILDKLGAAGLIPKEYKFQYIIALHSHGSAGMAPNSVSITSWGGIYDINSKQISDYLEAGSLIALTSPTDDKTGAAQLPLVYNDLIDHLIDPKGQNAKK